MNSPFLYDPIKWLRDQGVNIRLGLPQDGKQHLEICFEKGRYREPKKVREIYKRIEQSRSLILMQLKVDKGLPPRSVESLIAKGLIRIAYYEHGRRRYVITERGRRL